MKANGSKKRSGRGEQGIGKPRGVIHPRVAKAGPEHFGIVSVDCAKARFKWMLADFYGRVLVPPTEVNVTGPAMGSMLSQLAAAVAEHRLSDVLVAVEQTGRYHKPVVRALAAAGYDVRTVHPLASNRFRAAANPGVKTDDKDLGGIHMAAVNGFALLRAEADEFWTRLQLLVRHRRDLVRKASLLCCQIKEHWEAAMPGYAACFSNIWEHPAGLHLASRFAMDDPRPAAAVICSAGAEGLSDELHRQKIGFRAPSVQRIVEWARTAAGPDVGYAEHRRIAAELESDRQGKLRQIQGLERQIAAALARTPYILLLAIPGINVVSSGEYGGEMGPIGQYANSRCITGRAGLYPSRYQSDRVDHADGPLVFCGNRRLRYAILMIADNLVVLNHHFQALAAGWKQKGHDPRLIRVRVASRFCRISFQMVAGGQVFRHPAMRGRDYVLDKLIRFGQEHHTDALETLGNLRAAAKHLPANEWAAEAAPLAEELAAIRGGRRRGPQPLGEILPVVLAELGLGVVESGVSGAGPT